MKEKILQLQPTVDKKTSLRSARIAFGNFFYPQDVK